MIYAFHVAQVRHLRIDVRCGPGEIGGLDGCLIYWSSFGGQMDPNGMEDQWSTVARASHQAISASCGCMALKLLLPALAAPLGGRPLKL